MALFTEEPGLLIAAARDPRKTVPRSELVRDARLINKAVLKLDNDILVTNCAVDVLVSEGFLRKGDGGYQLTLPGAMALRSMQQRIGMLAEVLRRTGADEPIIDLTEEVVEA